MSKRYWVWIDGKLGQPPHELHAELGKHSDFVMGRSCGTWKAAALWLREYMKAGFVVRCYEVEE